MLTPVNIMVMMRGDGLCCYVIKAAFYPTRRPREGFGLIFPKSGRDDYFRIKGDSMNLTLIYDYVVESFFS